VEGDGKRSGRRPGRIDRHDKKTDASCLCEEGDALVANIKKKGAIPRKCNIQTAGKAHG